MRSEVGGNVNLDIYSDLITIAAGTQNKKTVLEQLSMMISDPECIVHRGDISTKIHNLILYIDGTLYTKYGTNVLHRFNNNELKELNKQVAVRILRDTQLYKKTGKTLKATRIKIPTMAEQRMEDLLIGSPYMSEDEARKSLIRAINDNRVLVEKDETSTRPAFNIGALRLCEDGELYHIDDIVTMYNFDKIDMQEINTAIEQRMLNDVELAIAIKHMKETKAQSAQTATATMTMFKKAQNWLAGIKQQFRTK